MCQSCKVREEMFGRQFYYLVPATRCPFVWHHSVFTAFFPVLVKHCIAIRELGIETGSETNSIRAYELEIFAAASALAFPKETESELLVVFPVHPILHQNRNHTNIFVIYCLSERPSRVR